MFHVFTALLTRELDLNLEMNWLLVICHIVKSPKKNFWIDLVERFVILRGRIAFPPSISCSKQVCPVDLGHPVNLALLHNLGFQVNEGFSKTKRLLFSQKIYQACVNYHQ